MSYHYHQDRCPHCGGRHNQRGCREVGCTTAVVKLENFTTGDGQPACEETCPETDEVYYVDFGDYPRGEIPKSTALHEE